MGSCLSTDGGGSSYGCCSGSCVPSSAKKRDKRNKTSLQALAAEAQTDAHLVRIPGRMWMNGEFGWNMDTIFCGVFDGYGPYGHLVAKRVGESLPSKLCSHWESMTRGDEGNNNIQEAGNAVGSINSDETVSIIEGQATKTIFTIQNDHR